MFLRSGVLSHLEEERDSRLHDQVRKHNLIFGGTTVFPKKSNCFFFNFQVVKFQALCRGHLARRNYQKLKVSVFAKSHYLFPQMYFKKTTLYFPEFFVIVLWETSALGRHSLIRSFGGSSVAWSLIVGRRNQYFPKSVGKLVLDGNYFFILFSRNAVVVILLGCLRLIFKLDVQSGSFL